MKTVILVYVLIGLIQSIIDAGYLKEAYNDHETMKELKEENLDSDIDLDMKCKKDAVLNEVISGNLKVIMIMHLVLGIIDIVAWPIMMYKNIIIFKDTIKRRLKK